MLLSFFLLILPSNQNFYLWTMNLPGLTTSLFSKWLPTPATNGWTVLLLSVVRVLGLDVGDCDEVGIWLTVWPAVCVAGLEEAVSVQCDLCGGGDVCCCTIECCCNVVVCESTMRSSLQALTGEWLCDRVSKSRERKSKGQSFKLRMYLKIGSYLISNSHVFYKTVDPCSNNICVASIPSDLQLWLIRLS